LQHGSKPRPLFAISGFPALKPTNPPLLLLLLMLLLPLMAIVSFPRCVSAATR
jgi:hypothetical protein